MSLLSVVIPTYERTSLLMKRAIPSVLSQKHDLDIEIIVVGDGEGPATGLALQMLDDPRIFYENRPRPEYPEDEGVKWCLIGYEARNWGYDHAQGDFIMALDDDDAYAVGAISTLYRELREFSADFVYGRSLAFDEANRHIASYGFYPPKHFAFCEGAWMAKHDLGWRFDLTCVERGLPADGDRIDRMVAGGVKFHFVDQVVHHYWPNRHPLVTTHH
jgi:glycosyltransferase involved in cell wall biosynthesis